MPSMIFFVLILLVSIAFGPALKAADLYTFADEEGANYFTNIPGEGRMRVSLPLKKPVSEPPFNHSSNVKSYEPIIAAASNRFAVDPNLIRAVIKAESNFNPRAVSNKGALGLMQLMPETAKEMAVANPFDPKENIYAGVRYFSELFQLFNRSLPLALAAYNAGPGRVIGKKEIPLIEETQNYVQRVMRDYRAFKEGFPIGRRE